MHLAILTGGGDVPGLNAVIKTTVEEACKLGWRVTGFRRGWAGPLNYNPDDPESSRDSIWPLDLEAVRTIDRTGGTVLHTSRTNPSRVGPSALPAFLKPAYGAGDGPVDCTPHVLSVLENLEIDVLIAIGGDDTLSYAARIHTEGVPTICIPKTMDNDVFGTDYCIGFSTCVNRSVEMIHQLRTPVGSHERILVVEMFGRNSGESALISGYLADADRILISEVPFDIDKLARLLERDRAANPSHYAILVVSEGASVEGGRPIESGKADPYGHRKLGGIGQWTGAEIKARAGVDVMVQNLGYLLRAGAPDAMDLMIAKNFATLAIQLIEAGKTGLMTVIEGGRYAVKPADISTKGVKRVDVETMYDTEGYSFRPSEIAGLPMFLR